MAEFVFTSPGVKFKERDLSYVTRNVGITTLGLVGETLKGPAFEPVFIQDKTQFSSRFGAQSIKRFTNGNLQYQLPYAANAFLDQAQQLWVTRVLGLSGYQAGRKSNDSNLNTPIWALRLEAGVDLSQTGITSSGVFTTGFTGSMFLGTVVDSIGKTGVYSSAWIKDIPTQIQTLVVKKFKVTAYTGQTGIGIVSGNTVTYTGKTLSEYQNMVVAVIRSRGISSIGVNQSSVTKFDTTTLTMPTNLTIVGSGDMFGKFTLLASSGVTNATYTVSLNPNDSSYLPNVIGAEPNDKNTMIYVQSIYPDLIKKLDAEGIAYGISSTLINATSNSFTDYATSFKTPETPWVVSQLMGSTLSKLFKLISISDGDAANQEIKISIANINPLTFEFDVYVRDFYDTDANPNFLESFTKCTMIKGTTNYIAQRIGTSNGEYTLNSKYIMVDIANDVPLDVFPAGFEGYPISDYAVSATTDSMNTIGKSPKILYKTEYTVNESVGNKLNKVYLGVSEHGYDSATSTGTGINQNFFNYNGQSGLVNTKGFHMDSGATGTYDGFQFEVGAGQFQTYADSNNPLNPYYNIKSRKFTFAPAGGFDGWDVNRIERSYGNGFQKGGIYDGVPVGATPVNDFQAWEMAIDTYSNPESVTINLFATPGINWSDQNILVQNTIEMIEQQRTDTLYIIDSPDIDITLTVGDGGKADVLAAQEVVQLLDDAEIDSSYGCTYFPWIQMYDSQNAVKVYVPATGEVAKAMAFTDNTAFPWFAPAGLNRGVTNAIKSKYKLSLEARDTLYAGRINPMADFADAGTAIFGQKTLQVKESALDRINVRRLLLQIKVLIANIAIRLVFEQNDQVTIDQFLSKANPILDAIKRERGLTDFRVKMDDSNNTTETRDRNELYGEIFLKPTRAVEFIGITFTITPSGASFSDVGA